MKRILIVEDQESINRMLQLNLKIAGYETEPAMDGGQAKELLDSGENYHLAVVDVMLPVMDGFALLPYFNERSIPVIFLTARGDLEAKLQGLTGGAEDYIVKPFEVPELLVRIEKVLARTSGADELILEHVMIDTASRNVLVNGEPLYLTPMEYDLLVLLARNRNVAMSRQRLLSEVWGFLYEGGTRTVDVHVAQLRKKTGLNIVSVPKIGYRLEVAR